jgi:PPIC-type PPIASE domain
MTINIEISDEDILEQVKISRKIPEIVEQIINRRVINNEAQKNGIEVKVTELQEAADLFRSKNDLVSVKKTQLWLAANKLSLDDFEEIIRFEIISDKVKEYILTGKVKEYFHQHKSDFDYVIMYEVIFESKEIAIEIYYAIREGETTFQDVAHKYMNNKMLAKKDGYVGKVRRKDISPELSSLFSVVNAPQIIKPMMTSKGFHLVWIEENNKAELNDEIYMEISDELFKDFLRQKIISSIESRSVL